MQDDPNMVKRRGRRVWEGKQAGHRALSQTMSPARTVSRAQYVFLAKLAEEAERSRDVIFQIKNMVHVYEARLTTEERNMLSVAYKNITNDLRRSWRVIDSLETSVKSSRQKARRVALIRQEKARIEQELAEACKDVVGLLKERLLPCAKSGEDMVFYAKMQGDYFRYLVEFAVKKERDHYAELSLSAYKLAYKHALNGLEPTHPTRLGLALNFAVYYHDVLKSPERACHLAKHAFDEALQCLEQDDSPPRQQNIQDALMILQLLKDDLVLWFSEIQNDTGANASKN